MTINSDTWDKDALLEALQAHGRDFLASFDLGNAVHEASGNSTKRKRRKLNSDEAPAPITAADETDEGEWQGFGSEEEDEGSESQSESDYSGESNDDLNDDEFRSDATAASGPQVISFSDIYSNGKSNNPSYGAKAFMSSKISKVTGDVKAEKAEKAAEEEEGEEYEEERNNLKNDSMLHKLIHTQLLAGPSMSDLNLTSAERRRAIEGRVMELAAGAKLGKGESIVRQKERSKAAKRVRLGLEHKVEVEKTKALEQAKELGNYHSSIKHLYETSSKKQPDRRKRDRGLKASVGKFRAGTLKLSHSDVASVINTGRSSRGKGNRRKI